MKSVKISVLVPTWNNRETLQRCLDSISNQALAELEILCIDAGSKDGTLDIIKAAEKEDQRVRYLRGTRRNCGFLLNRALREAKGTYIAVISPLNEIEEEMYRELVSIADREGLDFIQSAITVEGEESEQVHASYCNHVFAPAEERNWAEFPHEIENGIYRKSFLTESKIRFHELSGMEIPIASFRFQIFMQAQRAYFLSSEFCHIQAANQEIPDTMVKNIFKEYDFVGKILHHDDHLKEKFGHIYGKSCLQDIRRMTPGIPAELLRDFVNDAANYLEELHDEGLLDYNDLESEEHRELVALLYDRDKYCEDLQFRGTPRIGMEFIFPYHLFPEKSRIVLCGAGNEGRMIYRQAVHDNYVDIAGIIGDHAIDMGEDDISVQGLRDLSKMTYDYILLTSRNRDEAEEMKRKLLQMGVPEGKIRWDGASYSRDDFYHHLYFPMLRAWNENYGEHGQFLRAYEIKIRGSVNDHIFPYHLFREGMKVALYGAGDIGKKYYRQATHDNYVKIVGIVDRNPGEIYAPDVPVKAIQELKKMSYDYVLITVHGGGAAGSIKEDLKKLGIPENKIKWDGETYYRDEFYRNVYFPLLRRCGGDFQNRNQLIEGLQKKLHMTIYDHIFPYHLFREGETIAIYGAGDVGRKFYQQAKEYGWVKCVVIVDKNAEKINIPGIPVAPIGALKQFKFDKVLISMTNETWAKEARETMIRMGIADERIKWAGKIYWREHFYRKYWFDYLRFIHEMRRSKI